MDKDRFAALVQAAEERGPIEMSEDELADAEAEENAYDEFGRPRRVEYPKLAPLSPEVLDVETPEERAKLAGGRAGLDCETFLIAPGRVVPRLVVTGYQSADGRRAIVTGVDATTEGVTIDTRLPDGTPDPATHAKAFLAFTDQLLAQNITLTNQNISFDLCVIAESAHQADIALGLVGSVDSWFDRVMRRCFEILDRGVEDVQLRERLIDLAEGTLGRDFDNRTEKGNPRPKRYNLKALGKKYLDVDLDKLTFRLGYAKYWNKPLSAMEPGARKYVVDDVGAALAVAERQQRRAELHGLEPGRAIPNSVEQTRAAFALNLVSAWGMRTDLAKVQQLDADLDRVSRSLLRVLQEAGLVRTTGRDAGSRNMKEIHKLVVQMYEEKGLAVPRTEKGNVSTKGSVLEDIALIALRGHAKDVVDEKTGQIDEDELYKLPLYALSQYTSIKNTLQGTFLPVLYMGTRHPINTQFEVILENGRISSRKPNLNNLPRGGVKTLLQRLQSRVRACFVPRPGFVLSSVDYSAIELVCLAQILVWFFGSSKMADAINAGLDLHLMFAAEQLLHMSYDDAKHALKVLKDKHVKDMRQLAKVANFGLSGAMSARSFVEYAKASNNVYLTEEEARVLKEKWLAHWGEMRGYFKLIGSMMRGHDEFGQTIGDMEQFVSGRIRGRTRYCAMCNGFYSALAADGSKAALFEIARESYLLGGRLYGSRTIGYLYDEFLMEHPEETAHERAWIQTEIAVEQMQSYCKDVKVTAEPALMRCWYKDAEKVEDANGRLIPWEPKT